MTLQPSKRTITIHILPNISRSQDNQTLKFGQVIQYNWRDIFLSLAYNKNKLYKTLD